MATVIDAAEYEGFVARSVRDQDRCDNEPLADALSWLHVAAGDGRSAREAFQYSGQPRILT